MVEGKTISIQKTIPSLEQDKRPAGSALFLAEMVLSKDEYYSVTYAVFIMFVQCSNQ